MIAEKEKSGEWAVRRYQNCVIIFASVNADLVLGVLIFDRFNKSVVSAIKDATASRKEKIMAVTKDKRVRRILENAGYHLYRIVNDQFEMRT